MEPNLFVNLNFGSKNKKKSWEKFSSLSSGEQDH